MDFTSISGYPAVEPTLLALISLAETSMERDTSGSSQSCPHKSYGPIPVGLTYCQLTLTNAASENICFVYHNVWQDVIIFNLKGPI